MLCWPGILLLSWEKRAERWVVSLPFAETYEEEKRAFPVQGKGEKKDEQHFLAPVCST